MAHKIKLWLLAACAALAGIIVLLLKSKDGKVKELQKQLLMTKHDAEWQQTKKEVEDAKQKAKEADERARVGELNYRAAVRRYRNPEQK